MGEGEGNFYGFPALLKSDRTAKIPGAAVSYAVDEGEEDYYELKVAFHYRFDYDGTNDVVEDPLRVDRSLRPTDLGNLCRIVEEHFPLLQKPEENISHHAVCMYTMTHDEHLYVPVL